MSQLPFIGYDIYKMNELPSEVGIEIFMEYGSDYYWRYNLKELMKNREGKLSIHGPFVQLDLASRDCNWQDVLETYKWTYDFCNEFDAVHCVCHPHSDISTYSAEFSLKDSQKLALDRVLELNNIAKSMDVELLVENMPYKELVFQQADFTDVFGGQDELDFLIDLGHAMLHNWDIEKLLKDLNKRIKAYHVHENFGDKDAHLKVGEGPFDWQRFFTQFVEYSPDARLVFEYGKGPVSDIMDTIERTKEYLR